MIKHQKMSSNIVRRFTPVICVALFVALAIHLELARTHFSVNCLDVENKDALGKCLSLRANYAALTHEYERASRYAIMAHAVWPEYWQYAFDACTWNYKSKEHEYAINWCNRALSLSGTNVNHRAETIELLLKINEKANNIAISRKICDILSANNNLGSASNYQFCGASGSIMKTLQLDTVLNDRRLISLLLLLISCMVQTVYFYSGSFTTTLDSALYGNIIQSPNATPAEFKTFSLIAWFSNFNSGSLSSFFLVQSGMAIMMPSIYIGLWYPFREKLV